MSAARSASGLQSSRTITVDSAMETSPPEDPPTTLRSNLDPYKENDLSRPLVMALASCHSEIYLNLQQIPSRAEFSYCSPTLSFLRTLGRNGYQFVRKGH